jgi:hypothetical protein
MRQSHGNSCSFQHGGSIAEIVLFRTARDDNIACQAGRKSL